MAPHPLPVMEAPESPWMPQNVLWVPDWHTWWPDWRGVMFAHCMYTYTSKKRWGAFTWVSQDSSIIIIRCGRGSCYICMALNFSGSLMSETHAQKWLNNNISRTSQPRSSSSATKQFCSQRLSDKHGYNNQLFITSWIGQYKVNV